MTQQKKELVVRATNFSVIAKKLYKMASDEVLCQYVPKYERNGILVDEHGGVSGGHCAKYPMSRIRVADNT